MRLQHPPCEGVRGIRHWLVAAPLLAMLFAVSLTGPVSGAEESWKVAPLSSDDVSRLLKIAEARFYWGNPYPDLAPLVREKGLDSLVRALLRHENPKLRILGLSLAGFHRMGDLVGDDVMRLVKNKKEDSEVRDSAFMALPFIGIRLCKAVENAGDAKTQVAVVWRFGLSAGLMEADVGNWAWLDMGQILYDKRMPVETRRAAWLGLARARFRMVDTLVICDDEYWPFAEALQVSDDMRVDALLSREPVDLRQRLIGFLASSDKAAKVRAASFLAGKFHDPRGVEVVVDSLPCFNHPMPLYRSVGFFAYRTLQGIDDRILLRLAIKNLQSEDAKALSSLLGGYSSPQEAESKLGEYVNFESKHSADEKNKAVAILVRWLKPRMATLQWYVTSPELRLEESSQSDEEVRDEKRTDRK